MRQRRSSKNGILKNETPRCKCKNCKKTFQTDYVNKGSKPETKKLIVKMSVNGSGIIDISRVLEISKDTVMKVKKTEEKLTNVNPKYMNLEKPLTVRIEMDKMWGTVYSKKDPMLVVACY